MDASIVEHPLLTFQKGRLPPYLKPSFPNQSLVVSNAQPGKKPATITVLGSPFHNPMKFEDLCVVH